MKYLFFLSILMLLSMSATSCQRGSVTDPGTGASPSSTPASSSNWLIPANQVLDGGPGKDGIPSIDHPRFSSVLEVDFLEESDLVLLYKVGTQVHIYPHVILDWHEIINDVVANIPIAVTYCPLTGTGIGWNRVIGGAETTFGVSGLLYNSNLIPYDRATDSNWSQIGLNCVNGARIGSEVEVFQLLETQWRTAKAMYPDAQVVNTNTGFSRNYELYPYGNYRSSESLIFPVTTEDDLLPAKERVLGIMDGEMAKVYRFSSFTDRSLITDQFNGKDYLILGDQASNFLVAFQDDRSGVTFSAYSGGEDPAVVMKDTAGNYWNAFGEAVAGPDIGARLTPASSFLGYWFSWPAFFDTVEVFEK